MKELGYAIITMLLSGHILAWITKFVQRDYELENHWITAFFLGLGVYLILS